ncbi:hypothetical protein O6H91_15G063600 [Diphasiastrum complanatum]|uniref:Uncharacterized protein n=1 Tax=Diphasiastrum complanatum TaxID=34168 RepID=A0ACC2BJT7_DIPCM|nr:hypothetical protein O6H91_15G063600 [Diphasiastrum complanatum]
MSMAEHEKISLNVGGTVFVTTMSTIEIGGKNSLLAKLIQKQQNNDSDVTSKEIFIDRDPAYFSVLLQLLRTGELEIPKVMSEKALCREATFFGVLDCVRENQRGGLDGNRLRWKQSIHGDESTSDGTFIRASSEGGCCVARGSVVHVYDWTMEEQRPLNLDYLSVNDVGYLNPERIIICTYELTDQIGGMASFNTNTAKSINKYRLPYGDQTSNFTALALACSDRHVYASCRGRGLDQGIAVWDSTTGQHADFLRDSSGWPFGDASKLQWLPGSNLLLIASLSPHSDDTYLCLLDPRSRDKIWAWTDSTRQFKHTIHLLTDAVAMEESSTICVVNQAEQVGFIDMRVSCREPNWGMKYSRKLLKSGGEGCCYSKLAVNGSQLYCSHGDGVHVYCCSCSNGERARIVESCRVTTKKSKGKGTGPIADMAIGGDRLFVLRPSQNRFDIWETPYLPNEDKSKGKGDE